MAKYYRSGGRNYINHTGTELWNAGDRLGSNEKYIEGYQPFGGKKSRWDPDRVVLKVQTVAPYNCIEYYYTVNNYQDYYGPCDDFSGVGPCCGPC